MILRHPRRASRAQIRRGRAWRAASALALCAAFALSACGESEEPGQWECSAERNGWTRCGANGRVESCHGTRSPHFHNKDDCAEQGLSCAEPVAGQASCVGAQGCDASQTRCEDGKAYTCQDGLLKVQTCGTLQVCEVQGAAASCVLAIPQDEVCGGHGHLHDDHCHCDEGYAPAPDDALRCVAVADPDPEPEPDPDPDPDPDPNPNPNPEPGGYVFSPTRHVASWGLDPEGKDAWTYIGQAGSRAQMIIENLVNYGGRDMTGEYTIGADEQSYSTCGFCVLLETRCHSHGSDLHCEQTYMPKSGRFTLTKLDREAQGRFAGQLDDVVFQRVTINPQTLETRPVAGAPEVRLSMSFVWDAPLVVRQAPAQECGGHGHLHGDHCHCDAGYKVDPQDSKNCIPQ